MNLNLSRKVALITGASSGLGAATAILFAKLGTQLTLTGRNEVNLKLTAVECEKENTDVQPLLITGDLTREEDAQRIVEKTIERYGKLDILVNNAAIMATSSSALETKMEDFDAVMNTNVRAVFYLTRLALPHLIKAQGNIVNVSSTTSEKASPVFTGYNMSKAAIDQFTRNLSVEMSGKNVRVNSVNPGLFSMEMYRRIGLPEEILDMLRLEAAMKSPLQRMCTLDEVARVVAFVASDDASYLNGVRIPVDGGYGLKYS